MHIGFYAAALPTQPKPSGIVTYVSVMRDMLTALGHEVSVVTNDELLTPKDEVQSLNRRTRRGLVARIIGKARSLFNPGNDHNTIVASAIVQAHSIQASIYSRWRKVLAGRQTLRAGSTSPS